MTPPTTVLNVRIHHEAIEDARREGRYVPIHRPYEFGNPYVIGKNGTRAEVIARYETYLHGRPDLLAKIPALKGMVLGCFCRPLLPCHGDVLARLADAS